MAPLAAFRLGRRFAGAIAIALALAPSAVAETRQTVTLVMTEYRFVPPKLRFRTGHAYRLVLVNHGKELHEFTAPDFLRAIAVDNPNVLVAGGREISLPAGARSELLFSARRRGQFPLSCADHDWAGMVGTITID
jgi:uncharacterized cupredoxin-like copper-binding protein